jgi:hypothetical protein
MGVPTVTEDAVLAEVALVALEHLGLQEHLPIVGAAMESKTFSVAF